MDKKKILIITLLVILVIVLALVLFKKEKVQTGNGSNMTKEVEDVYKIVSFVNFGNLEINKEYSTKDISNDSKIYMIFNYLNLKEKIDDNIACSELDKFSESLFNEGVNYDELLLNYDGYIYQKDKDKIVRSKLDIKPTKNYNTEVDSYSIEGNNIILSVKITGGINNSELKGVKILKYVFVNNSEEYGFKSVTLIQDYEKKDKEENNNIQLDKKDENGTIQDNENAVNNQAIINDDSSDSTISIETAEDEGQTETE